jgi:hypothetical protein
VLRTLEEIPLADESDEDGIVLAPEDEAELVRVIATNDENERAGRGIPLHRFLAQRGMG